MASTALAQAVGYPGTSIAFAQLLSGMERSGLIRREIRGKRTYRIELTDQGRSRARGTTPAGETLEVQRSNAGRPVATAPVRASAPHRPEPEVQPRGSDKVDYDELARHLLVQVAQRLAREEVERQEAVGSPGSGRTWVDRRVVGLERKLGELERELARARAAREELERENEELREQLERTRQNLEVMESRMGPRPVATKAGRPRSVEGLDEAELALLQRMLVRPPGKKAGVGRAGLGEESGAIPG